MKSLKYLMPVLLLTLLSACAVMPPAEKTVRAPDVGERGAARQPTAANTQSASWPKLELTPEIMFGVLASEIAAQRGEINSAAMTEMAMAEHTRDPRLAERAAQFSLLAGDLRGAIQALQLWLKLDPGNSLASEQLVVLYLRSGNVQQSSQLIKQLLQQKPNMAPTLFVQIARLLPLQTKKEQSYQMVRQLTQAYPQVPEAHFAMIAAASEANDQAVVNDQFDMLAKLAPKWDLPVAWMADRLHKTSPAAAVAFLQKELPRRPDASLELKMAYPRLLVSLKRFPEARVAFDRLLKQNPRQPDLLYAAGLLAFQLNDLPAARQQLEAALQEHYPDTEFLRFTLGQVAETQGDVKTAQHWYLQVGPSAQYLPAQVRLAYLESQTGQLQQALNRLSKLGATDQERTEVTLIQAEMARAAKRYDLAMSALNQGLLRHPRQPEMLYERALIADLANNPQSAERDLQLLLKLQPENQQALNALGYILATRTTRYAEAHRLISRALKLEPDNPMILDSMGWVLYKMGHKEDALRYLAQAYHVLSDQEIAAHYGEVLWSMGRQQEARTLWLKAQQTDHDHPDIDEVRHRLHSE